MPPSPENIFSPLYKNLLAFRRPMVVQRDYRAEFMLNSQFSFSINDNKEKNKYLNTRIVGALSFPLPFYHCCALNLFIIIYFLISGISLGCILRWEDGNDTRRAWSAIISWRKIRGTKAGLL